MNQQRSPLCLELQVPHTHFGLVILDLPCVFWSTSGWSMLMEVLLMASRVSKLTCDVRCSSWGTNFPPDTVSGLPCEVRCSSWVLDVPCEVRCSLGSVCDVVIWIHSLFLIFQLQFFVFISQNFSKFQGSLLFPLWFQTWTILKPWHLFCAGTGSLALNKPLNKCFFFF